MAEIEDHPEGGEEFYAEETVAGELPVKTQLTCTHCGSARLHLLAVTQPLRLPTGSSAPTDSS